MLSFAHSCNCIKIELYASVKVQDRAKECFIYKWSCSQTKFLEREAAVATLHILTLIRLTQAQSAQNPLFSTKVSSFLLKMRKKVAVASIFLIQRFDVDFSHHC